jgi:hypothetical protein
MALTLSFWAVRLSAKSRALATVDLTSATMPLTSGVAARRLSEKPEMLSTAAWTLAGSMPATTCLTFPSVSLSPVENSPSWVAMVSAWEMTPWMFSEASAARRMKSSVEVRMPSTLAGSTAVTISSALAMMPSRAGREPACGVRQFRDAGEEVLDVLGIVGKRAGEGLDVPGSVGDRGLVVGEEPVETGRDRLELADGRARCGEDVAEGRLVADDLRRGLGEDALRGAGATGHLDIGDAGQEVGADDGAGVGLDGHILAHLGRHQHLVRVLVVEGERRDVADLDAGEVDRAARGEAADPSPRTRNRRSSAGRSRRGA